MNDQTVKCWGRNNLGQIGIGSMSTTVLQPSPVAVIGLPKPVVELSVGGWHACARMNDGVVKCWGSNEAGQIGDGGYGAAASRATPATVVGLPSPTALSAGGLHTCAQIASGWQCWGYDTYGQLGIGSKDDQTTPQPVKL
jgi:alpha-tubulin suppressor-like RCC1 family protein